MAYFGGEQAQRPWSRMSPMILVLNALFGAMLLMVAYHLLSGDLLKGGSGSSETKSPAAVGPVAEVLVPVQNIPQGVELDASMFTLEERPIKGIETKTLKDINAVRGSFSRTLIVAGAPLLKDQLASNLTNVITGRIPTGFRAVAIPVDASSGVEGWVQPGARVDVVWVTRRRGRDIVSIIVENAEVLSAERSTAKTSASQAKNTKVPSHITLMVSIKDAQKIQLAKASRGSLSLSLRGDEDMATAGGETTASSSLLRRNELQTLDMEEARIKIGRKDYVMQAGELVLAEKVKKR